MDPALIGLAGTAVGAIAGIAGAWLTQRGQLRMQREQRAYEERVRWLDDKRRLYRDLLTNVYGWHDALVSIWQNEADETLFEVRAAATEHSIEASLIASKPVRSSIEQLRAAFFAVQPAILSGASSEHADPPLAQVREKILQLEDALRTDLVDPDRLHARPRSRARRPR